jgi:hypothetical protein
MVVSTAFLANNQLESMKYHVRRIWFTIVTMILTGLPLWLSSYQSFNTYSYYSLGILSILSFIFLAFSYCSWKDLFKMQMLGFFLAWVIKVVIDATKDPTSHNLLPFELAIMLFIAFIATSIGIGLAVLVQFLRGRVRG